MSNRTLGVPLSNKALHDRLRPETWDDVIGQDAAVKSLSAEIRRRESHTFLLTGPSGVGKTTLARIAATELGCHPVDRHEIDAADHTGVDDMREVKNAAQYISLGGGARCAIIDECHMLSKSAWNTLLKVTEEPPDHAYWFFCTTEPNKVPPTIKTRCFPVALSLIHPRDIGDLYDVVCEKECIDIPGDVGDLIIREANGSARQLLINITACREIDDKREAARVLQTVDESDATIELCRLFASGKTSWARAMSIINKLDGESPESVRIIVRNYFGKAARGAKSDRDACHFLSILEAFGTPYNASEGLGPLMTSIGRVVFPE